MHSLLQTFVLISLRYLQTALLHAGQAEDPDDDAVGWLFKRMPSKPKAAKGWGKKKKNKDVESASASESGDDNVEVIEEEPYMDSFDSDSFDSDEDDGSATMQYQPRHQESQVEQMVAEEPQYANMPFHEDQDRLQDALTSNKASPPPRPTEGPKSHEKDNKASSKDSKKSKTDSPKKVSKKESPKKTSKKDTKSPSKKESKATSKKDTKTSSKKDAKTPTKQVKTSSQKKGATKSSKKGTSSVKKTPSPKKKSPSTKKKSPSTKKKSPSIKKKSPSIKKKSTKRKSSKKSGKFKMKNKNNNIDDNSSMSSDDESDAMDTTPLLRKFYSSSEGELCYGAGDQHCAREQPIGMPACMASDPPPKEFARAGPSPEVTWLLSRTQFYSSSPSNCRMSNSVNED